MISGTSTDKLLFFGRVPRLMGQVFPPDLVLSTVGSEDFTGLTGPINLLGFRVLSLRSSPLSPVCNALKQQSSTSFLNYVKLKFIDE